MLCTFRVHSTKLDEEDPWSGILGAVMFATRATIHGTSRATPAQLVFGRDAMLNVRHEANWAYIRERKQRLIKENNKRENAKRRAHTYTIGDSVLIKKDQPSKYGSDAYAGPYEIVKVNNNGTVRVREGAVTDTYNIRMISPYKH